jgi:hypothetical protein
MGKLTVSMDPAQREKYIDQLLELDGLSHIKEDPNAAYCTISLTNTPDQLKEVVKNRQRILKDILGKVGITPYDPETAPFSPDRDLTTQPNQVYTVDSGKIVGARYFTSHNLLPSSGGGIEVEKAKTLNRIATVFMDKNVRISRMQPHRTIYLEYQNFEEQQKQFLSVFELLKEYNPGMGFNDKLPVLLGFHKQTGNVVDLEEKVYNEFPDLQYKYNGKVPIAKLKAENPEVFYEMRGSQIVGPHIC